MNYDLSDHAHDTEGGVRTAAVRGTRALVDKSITKVSTTRTECPDGIIGNECLHWLHREHMV